MLVDTSVWVDHFRRGNDELRTLLARDDVATHPFVVGELACGNLRARREILRWLGHLPTVAVAEHGEVLALIESRRLAGRGLGWIDAHLLASALIAEVPLLSLDRRLLATARALGVA